MTALAKLVVSRPRPAPVLHLVAADGAAFPSGHATQSVACWGALGVVAVVVPRRRWIRLAAVLTAAALAVSIGLSRVYLGVHWFSDVVCGWAVAMLWLTMLLVVGTTGPRLVPVVRREVRARATGRRSISGHGSRAP